MKRRGLANFEQKEKSLGKNARLMYKFIHFIVFQQKGRIHQD